MEGEGGEGEWGSPTHYFQLKSCIAPSAGVPKMEFFPNIPQTNYHYLVDHT